MESILQVYLTAFGVILAVSVFVLLQRHKSESHKLAKIRVYVDENRRGRHMHKPPEEEFETRPILGFMAIGALLLLIVIYASSL